MPGCSTVCDAVIPAEGDGGYHSQLTHDKVLELQKYRRARARRTVDVAQPAWAQSSCPEIAEVGDTYIVLAERSGPVRIEPIDIRTEFDTARRPLPARLRHLREAASRDAGPKKRHLDCLFESAEDATLQGTPASKQPLPCDDDGGVVAGLLPDTLYALQVLGKTVLVLTLARLDIHRQLWVGLGSARFSLASVCKLDVPYTRNEVQRALAARRGAACRRPGGRFCREKRTACAGCSSVLLVAPPAARAESRREVSLCVAARPPVDEAGDLAPADAAWSYPMRSEANPHVSHAEGGASTILLQNLTAEITYAVRVRPVYSGGHGTWSSCVLFTTEAVTAQVEASLHPREAASPSKKLAAHASAASFAATPLLLMKARNLGSPNPSSLFLPSLAPPDEPTIRCALAWAFKPGSPPSGAQVSQWMVQVVAVPDHAATKRKLPPALLRLLADFAARDDTAPAEMPPSPALPSGDSVYAGSVDVVRSTYSGSRASSLVEAEETARFGQYTGKVVAGAAEGNELRKGGVSLYRDFVFPGGCARASICVPAAPRAGVPMRFVFVVIPRENGRWLVNGGCVCSVSQGEVTPADPPPGKGAPPNPATTGAPRGIPGGGTTTTTTGRLKKPTGGSALFEATGAEQGGGHLTPKAHARSTSFVRIAAASGCESLAGSGRRSPKAGRGPAFNPCGSVAVDAVGEQTANVTWRPEGSEPGCAAAAAASVVVQYRVEVVERIDDEAEPTPTVVVFRTNEASWMLSKLRAGAHYTVRICAYNEAEKSWFSYSPACAFETLAVPELQVSEVSQGELHYTVKLSNAARDVLLQIHTATLPHPLWQGAEPGLAGWAADDDDPETLETHPSTTAFTQTLKPNHKYIVCARQEISMTSSFGAWSEPVVVTCASLLVETTSIQGCLLVKWDCGLTQPIDTALPAPVCSLSVHSPQFDLTETVPLRPDTAVAGQMLCDLPFNRYKLSMQAVVVERSEESLLFDSVPVPKTAVADVVHLSKFALVLSSIAEDFVQGYLTPHRDKADIDHETSGVYRFCELDGTEAPSPPLLGDRMVNDSSPAEELRFLSVLQDVRRESEKRLNFRTGVAVEEAEFCVRSGHDQGKESGPCTALVRTRLSMPRLGFTLHDLSPGTVHSVSVRVRLRNNGGLVWVTQWSEEVRFQSAASLTLAVTSIGATFAELSWAEEHQSGDRRPPGSISREGSEALPYLRREFRGQISRDEEEWYVVTPRRPAADAPPAQAPEEDAATMVRFADGAPCGAMSTGLPPAAGRAQHQPSQQQRQTRARERNTRSVKTAGSCSTLNSQAADITPAVPPHDDTSENTSSGNLLPTSSSMLRADSADTRQTAEPPVPQLKPERPKPPPLKPLEADAFDFGWQRTLGDPPDEESSGSTSSSPTADSPASSSCPTNSLLGSTPELCLTPDSPQLCERSGHPLDTSDVSSADLGCIPRPERVEVPSALLLHQREKDGCYDAPFDFLEPRPYLSKLFSVLSDYLVEVSVPGRAEAAAETRRFRVERRVHTAVFLDLPPYTRVGVRLKRGPHTARGHWGATAYFETEPCLKMVARWISETNACFCIEDDAIPGATAPEKPTPGRIESRPSAWVYTASPPSETTDGASFFIKVHELASDTDPAGGVLCWRHARSNGEDIELSSLDPDAWYAVHIRRSDSRLWVPLARFKTSAPRRFTATDFTEASVQLQWSLACAGTVVQPLTPAKQPPACAAAAGAADLRWFFHRAPYRMERAVVKIAQCSPPAAAGGVSVVLPENTGSRRVAGLRHDTAYDVLLCQHNNGKRAGVRGPRREVVGMSADHLGCSSEHLMKTIEGRSEHDRATLGLLFVTAPQVVLKLAFLGTTTACVSAQKQASAVDAAALVKSREAGRRREGAAVPVAVPPQREASYELRVFETDELNEVSLAQGSRMPASSVRAREASSNTWIMDGLRPNAPYTAMARLLATPTTPADQPPNEVHWSNPLHFQPLSPVACCVLRATDTAALLYFTRKALPEHLSHVRTHSKFGLRVNGSQVDATFSVQPSSSRRVNVVTNVPDATFVVSCRDLVHDASTSPGSETAWGGWADVAVFRTQSTVPAAPVLYEMTAAHVSFWWMSSAAGEQPRAAAGPRRPSLPGRGESVLSEAALAHALEAVARSGEPPRAVGNRPRRLDRPADPGPAERAPATATASSASDASDDDNDDEEAASTGSPAPPDRPRNPRKPRRKLRPRKGQKPGGKSPRGAGKAKGKGKGKGPRRKAGRSPAPQNRVLQGRPP
ncbi:hypothetical protein DIPPA_18965 [Diplonema papillatum]|nr:hypothetical protein DIPPA_18965 [Diplonema papillatum]